MPCDTWQKPNQTKSQRVAEVSRVVSKVSDLIAAGRVRVKVGPQGAVAFDGIPDEVRDKVTDACIYRRMLVSGSALARAKIAQAEQVAGRGVSKQALAAGIHSHDGGRTFHDGH